MLNQSNRNFSPNLYQPAEQCRFFEMKFLVRSQRKFNRLDITPIDFSSNDR